MTTINPLATAADVEALVSAGTVPAGEAMIFLATRFARKLRDGKAVSQAPLAAFARIAGQPDSPPAGGFVAWRDGLLALAKPVAAALPPKAAAAPKAKASAKGKAAPKARTTRGKPATPKASSGKADAPFTPAQTKALAKMFGEIVARIAK